MSEEKQHRKASSVRHTQAVQCDHTKHSIPGPTAEETRERLTEIVHPTTLEQVGYFHQLGLREWTLSLVVMVAFVLEMIWGQISVVNEMVRLIQTEAMVWASPQKVSQQALSQRLTSLPSHLYLNILHSIFPLMKKHWAERKAPLPPEIAWAKECHSEVQVVNGSTLDTLICKIGLLKDLPAEALRWVFDLNLMGTISPSQVYGKIMAQQKNCVILNISAMNVFRPLTRIPAYSAAKARVGNFT